ncbi:twin-arginine translocase TatA/TatE family subunit [Microlunatus speluncae]|uniref:twin-arginine translocase TatA/TatE family subunit n=1 Tax=Microlunatus speluncae TaxID=2594267 RepID=UPI0012663572|nr:twin-arginine translocase TatA/TatE family subunit [Microlunatus speluncae]
MTPLAFPLGPTELIIILVIVVLLFGGSRLAGLGKSTGRALKEFKEETSGLRGKSDEEKGEEKPGTDARAAAELEADRAQKPMAEPTNSELRKDA